MRTILKVGLGMLLLAMVLISVSYSLLKAQGVANPASAAGRVTQQESREVGSQISAVDLNGPIELTLRQGVTPAMRISGEQRLLGNVTTSQSAGVLHIGTKGVLFHHRRPLQVELVLPALTQLVLHGSGDSSVNGFSGEDFHLELHGSGNVTFNGRFNNLAGMLYGSGDLHLNNPNSQRVVLEMVGSGTMTATGSSVRLDATVNGSGDLDAEHLAADKVVVLLKGSGSANLFARRQADLTLHGSGDIQVHGAPAQRNVDRSGSGDIIWH